MLALECQVCQRTVEPKWLEQFDLHLFDEHQKRLEMMLFDKKTNLFMGRCSIELDSLQMELTHERWFELEDGAGSVLILLSITGTVGADAVSDMHTFDSGQRYFSEIQHKYVRIYLAVG